MNKNLTLLLFILFILGSCASKKVEQKNDLGASNKKAINYGKEIPPVPPPPPPPPHEENGFIGIIEIQPRFPGCEHLNLDNNELEKCSKDLLIEFIYSNLVYPEEAKKKGIEGTALVRFKIDTDGAMKDLKLLRDLEEGCGEAALNVIKKMQENYTWIPGTQRGKVVVVHYTIPIKFHL